jgi:hypothetical protein
MYTEKKKKSTRFIYLIVVDKKVKEIYGVYLIIVVDTERILQIFLKHNFRNMVIMLFVVKGI